MGGSQSHWSWQGLWKWAALDQGLGLTLVEGESSCALARVLCQVVKREAVGRAVGCKAAPVLDFTLGRPSSPCRCSQALLSRLAPVRTRVTVLASALASPLPVLSCGCCARAQRWACCPPGGVCDPRGGRFSRASQGWLSQGQALAVRLPLCSSPWDGGGGEGRDWTDG